MTEDEVTLTEEQKDRLETLIRDLEAAANSQDPVSRVRRVPPPVSVDFCLVSEVAIDAADRPHLASVITWFRDLLAQARSGQAIRLPPGRVSGRFC
jgi:hypothetical protein